MKNETVLEAVVSYLKQVEHKYSSSTTRTYQMSINGFLNDIRDTGIDLNELPIDKIKEDWIFHYIESIRELAPSTQHVYLSSVLGLYKYLESEKRIPIDLNRSITNTIIPRNIIWFTKFHVLLIMQLIFPKKTVMIQEKN